MKEKQTQRKNTKNLKQLNYIKEEQVKITNRLKQANNLKIVATIVIVAIIVVLFLTGYSIGKSISTAIINTDTEVAEPILAVNSEPSIDITATEEEGTYRFYVRNYENEETEKVTETNLRYWIEIKPTEIDEAITYELYKNGQEIELDENNKTEIQVMKKEIKQEDVYELKIKYEKEKSTQMQDILEKIQIKVHSEQEKA